MYDASNPRLQGTPVSAFGFGKPANQSAEHRLPYSVSGTKRPFVCSPLDAGF
jgi:hypothetical protein